MEQSNLSSHRSRSKSSSHFHLQTGPSMWRLPPTARNRQRGRGWRSEGCEQPWKGLGACTARSAGTRRERGGREIHRQQFELTGTPAQQYKGSWAVEAPTSQRHGKGTAARSAGDRSGGFRAAACRPGSSPATHARRQQLGRAPGTPRAALRPILTLEATSCSGEGTGSGWGGQGGWFEPPGGAQPQASGPSPAACSNAMTAWQRRGGRCSLQAGRTGRQTPAAGGEGWRADPAPLQPHILTHRRRGPGRPAPTPAAAPCCTWLRAAACTNSRSAEQLSK